MREQTIFISHEFQAPVAKVFQFLSVHENLSTIFAPAKVKLTKAASGNNPNGLGSVRHVLIPLAPATEETVTQFIENQLIEYKITNLGPLKDHLGTMIFVNLGDKSRLDYTIKFKGRLPFIGPIMKTVLGNAIKKGLRKVPV